MRIIAGKYRRRKLRTNPGATTRPITDRVKDILFSRLHDTFEGARVADVFAGTGTLGLEALSRGAARVVFIERDRKAAELLRENVATLGVDDVTFCWNADALRSSFRPRGLPDFLPYDVIFFDPPYRMVSDIAPGAPLFHSLRRLAREGISREETLLIFRTAERARFEMPEEWHLDQVMPISSMEVHLFRRGTLDAAGPEDASEAASDNHGDGDADGNAESHTDDRP